MTSRFTDPTIPLPKEPVAQIVPPHPMNNFADFAKLMHSANTLPPGQSLFTLAVPVVFEMNEEFTAEAFAALKERLREQFELGLQIIDTGVTNDVLREDGERKSLIIMPGGN